MFTLSVALVSAFSGNAHAVGPASEAAEHGLQLRAVGQSGGVRTVRRVDAIAPTSQLGSWTRFIRDRGATWSALWDAQTGVPLRVFGAGTPAPGAISDPARAEVFARQALRAHLDLFAPGSVEGDFELVSNVLSGGVRSIGFVQRWRGVRVLGGQLSFRFKADKLVAIGSEALPFVTAEEPRASLSPITARQVAADWIALDHGVARPGTVEGPFILPLVGSNGAIDYRTVLRVACDSAAPLGVWDVYVDANDGSEVARQQTLVNATASLSMEVPERRPGATLRDYPATGAAVTIDDQEIIVDADGLVSWDGDASTLIVRPSGPRATVVDAAESGLGLQSFPIADGDAVTWSASDAEFLDAQLTAFIHVELANQYARRLAPDLPFLDQQMTVTVNIDQECNANSNLGARINFFRSSDRCANTARLSDVVYHEFGHSLHGQSIIPGVGATDTALSEGLSDYLAATINDDSGMGRGFFKDGEPLRELDPEDSENVWPRDIAGVHTTGMIIGGALWDLRKELIAKYGKEAGVAATDLLYYESLRRASDIPSMYVEVLLSDDDDGDLSNGTPNVCEINRAFGAHGLRVMRAEIDPITTVAATASEVPVGLRLFGLSSLCEGDGPAQATATWRLRTRPDVGGEVALQDSGDGFVGGLPLAPAGNVIEYQVRVEYEDGSEQFFPNNPADPFFDVFVGEATPIYCTDFESDPVLEGWRHGLLAGQPTGGGDDWQWGAPNGRAGDPFAALSGTSVFGNDLGGPGFDGLYQPDRVSFAEMPSVDVAGFDNVRVQYWRWLGVEDGFYDRATLTVDGQGVWENAATPADERSKSLHHRDRQWVFHDIDITGALTNDEPVIRFELSSDSGLEFGGWTIDDLCLVGVNGTFCGDGVITGGEECDDGDGNSDVASGACRTDCSEPRCGDGVRDGAEACDDGNSEDGDDCTALCTFPQVEEDGGCRAAGDSRGNHHRLPWILGALALAWRRRRRAAR